MEINTQEPSLHILFHCGNLMTFIQPYSVHKSWHKVNLLKFHKQTSVIIPFQLRTSLWAHQQTNIPRKSLKMKNVLLFQVKINPK